MARKGKKQEEKKGAPEWMVTFSDMMTLLLCFFVLLFSFSSIDAQKWKELIRAFTGAPSIFTDPASIIDEPDQTDPDATEESPNAADDVAQYDDSGGFEQLYQSLMDFANAAGLGVVDIEKNDYEIMVRFTESVLFDSGRADLRPGATDVLDEIIYRVKPYITNTLQTIRIEGHTDNRPIHTSQFPNNWWLSTTRAGNVLMYIIDSNPEINPAFFSCQGRGEYVPIADNDSPENMEKNRRVEFILVRSLESDGPNEVPR